MGMRGPMRSANLPTYTASSMGQMAYSAINTPIMN